MRARVANWGNYPVAEADRVPLRSEAGLRRLLESGARGMIARGMGRCYGDSALADLLIDTGPYRRILSFDAGPGRVRCEAGVTLDDLFRVFLPRGWIPPVIPGTRHVTLGGAIAADVHGKGPGAFCDHVTAIRLMTAGGDTQTCSPEENPVLFETTRGGMGLTGVILEATVQMMPVRSAYIREHRIPCRDLEEVMRRFEEEAPERYSVAWIDCVATGRGLGRGVLMRGDHADPADLSGAAARGDPLRLSPRREVGLPCYLPNFTLNPLTVRLFNRLFALSNPERRRIVGFETFFHPLDRIRNWNRLYGRRGFLQYQFLLPAETCGRGLPEMLGRIAAMGTGSFLAVLKRFGPHETFMSFPMEGYFLALDFPLSRRLFAQLDELDRRLLDLGGRLYLAKDARMKPETFFAGYPNARAFARRLRTWDPGARFQSHQSRRLGLHGGGWAGAGASP